MTYVIPVKEKRLVEKTETIQEEVDSDKLVKVYYSNPQVVNRDFERRLIKQLSQEAFYALSIIKPNVCGIYNALKTGESSNIFVLKKDFKEYLGAYRKKAGRIRDELTDNGVCSFMKVWRTKQQLGANRGKYIDIIVFNPNYMRTKNVLKEIFEKFETCQEMSQNLPTSLQSEE